MTATGGRATPAKAPRAAADPIGPAGAARRIVACFEKAAADGRGLLSIYLTAGHPDLERSRRNFEAAIAGGADFVEVGIPFSDPVADGPAIQAAAAHALKGGTKVADALALARALRNAHPDTPMVAMTYANLVQRHGWDGFARALAEAGVDGLIVPDVPLEEAGPLREALASHGLAHIPLVTPTTDAARMEAIAGTATGFLYVVANVGVTGQADPGPLVARTVDRARKAAPGIPLAVGFGVRSAGDVQRLLEAGADAVIVGSHAVRVAQDGGDLRAMVAGLSRAAKGLA